MKLVFNSIISGLGNNGGTRTVLLCQKVLEEMGHKVDVCAIVDNFTWFDHKKVISHIPNDTDVIIAVACSDVIPTLETNIKKKAWFIRGHENWSMDDYTLGCLYRDHRFLNIVNSKGLQAKLKNGFNADSVVVYQGIDIETWSDRKLRSKDKIRIGCLSNKRHVTKRWEDFIALSEILSHNDYEYVAFGLESRNDSFLADFLQNPSHNDLVDLYSSCHIFFLSTVLEGLHNVGLEAALCGCLLVGNDGLLNGMSYDYLFDNKTGMVYPSSDINIAAELIRNPDWSLIPKAQKFIINKIGSREKNMKSFMGIFE